MSTPSSILALVERFDADRDYYRSQRYKETEARREFIDPLFEALGWDVGNRRGAAAIAREVLMEFSYRRDANIHTPDYLFRVGPHPKFFVEAKKPAVNLWDGVAPAYQVQRYAWTAKLPVSVLTDFEEFACYDCRAEPKQTAPAASGRVQFYTYQDYATKWDEIAELFHRDAVLSGSLERFAHQQKAPKGALPVDKAFLAEINRWRAELARQIWLWDRTLSTRDLNYAVQMTIDRILFLRICEDRGIEEYKRLEQLAHGGKVYQRLLQLFRDADDRYNSGLFHFEKEKGREAADTLTPHLYIPDEPLRDIITSLYFPRCPYEFSVMPVEVLGQVYEQFLGKIITIGATDTVEVEEKPAVRKAGGVYYTPEYIVDYIVTNTVGKLVAGKTPQQVASLRIADIACGSGSFLIGAYQYLLDWHLQQYLAESTTKHRRRVYDRGKGDWRLTIEERKRILLNNIYGVDLDAQAVEVTKLSLCLKMLEGETDQTLVYQHQFARERVLPDLDNNIKCGNALIGKDFYSIATTSKVSNEELLQINPFDWQTEFPEVMRAGGFDAIVGNPPYIRIHNLVDYHPQAVRFIQDTYISAAFGKIDIYIAFVERGLALLRSTGLLGYILPNKFMQADYGVGLRTLIAGRQALHQLVDFNVAQVFENATIYTCLLFLSGTKQEAFTSAFLTTGQNPTTILRHLAFEQADSSQLDGAPWTLAYANETAIVRKLEAKGCPLPQFVEQAITGVKTGANSVFIFELVSQSDTTYCLRSEDGGWVVELEKEFVVPFWKADGMKRYRNGPATRMLLYPHRLVNGKTVLVPEQVIQSQFPRTWQYLDLHRGALEGRQKGKLKGPSWFGQSFASSLSMFTATKIVTPTLAPTNSFSLDTGGHLFPQGAGGGCGMVANTGQSPAYLLGVLNARLLTFFVQRISSCFQGGWYAYEPRYLNRIPIRPIDFLKPVDMAYHDQIVALVEKMLELNKRLPAAKTSQERGVIQRQSEATDRQIDELVYQLYDLTAEEIAIVEAATKY